ncbi:MAG: hypothetical protein ACRDEA_17910 [Microcystaceae cyanobacterium]
MTDYWKGLQQFSFQAEILVITVPARGAVGTPVAAPRSYVGSPGYGVGTPGYGAGGVGGTGRGAGGVGR